MACRSGLPDGTSEELVEDVVWGRREQIFSDRKFIQELDRSGPATSSSVGRMRLMRRVLYALATNTALEGAVRSLPPVERISYRKARRYVAGTTLDDALVVIDRLHGNGLAASLDFFGETETDPQALQTVVREYHEAAGELANRDADVYLEIVPSHIGVDVSAEIYRQYVEQIVKALPPRTHLQISAEESSRTPRIIETTVALAREGAPVIQTLQANLLRSDDYVERLISANVPIRLVKAAYLEGADVVRPWGDETDLAYVRLAHRIREAGLDLTLGTHDPLIREALLTALPDIGVEMLLGVREEDALDLVSRGHHVRIYVPFGDDWFRYWMRRVAESAGA